MTVGKAESSNVGRLKQSKKREGESENVCVWKKEDERNGRERRERERRFTCTNDRNQQTTTTTQ